MCSCSTPPCTTKSLSGRGRWAWATGKIDRRVQDCLGIFGLQELAENVPYHLSGGEKRGVALAGVLALNPDVVLLDEPLVGLTSQ
ncbi:MAG: ATP-binding cassette domain-containing protein [Bacteroidales bacterium]|nr:ATP-binding cassette domain-containing protein [Bacteroidales bacterium]